ncbi:competence type IV pilus ATPase ComGA [Pseudalkalibacillus caeni]|uniref:competence type IV pilus ATPase ComGA n=1 Tax=Exobacillus caeni TaxID=2574798 RepID=UPI0014857E2A|nr:competence type IV pilus ATPase ComGA [Pseudalkalibacillus caeni]
MNEIEKLGKKIILQALSLKASDIHFHPGQTKTLVQLRIDSFLYQVRTIPTPTAEKLISHFKFSSGMDIGEKRRPQSGAQVIKLMSHEVNVRMSTIPTPFQESLVIRILDHDTVKNPKQLCLFPRHGTKLESLIQHPHGLLLFTGSTGSGKTTTIYSLLHWISKKDKKRIITIEDPIERPNEVFIQLEVNEKAGITFAEGLKACLRHDPDIIMIGEIRDETTAQIAIRAAMTGHLVVSTLHTKNTYESVYRFLEFGVPKSYIEQTFIGVVNQVLVTLKCPFCKNCCFDCKRNREKHRFALYEILSGDSLKAAVGISRHDMTQMRTLNNELRLAWALGYVEECNFFGGALNG